VGIVVFDTRIEQLAFFVTHLEEISGIAHLPTCCFQRFAFCGVHRSVLTSWVASWSV